MTHSQTLLKKIIDRQLLFLDMTYQAYTKTYQEARGEKKADEDFFIDNITRVRLTHLQYEVALTLDLLHQSFPDIYDLFPERKEIIDKVESLFRTYQHHKVLNECKCNYCLSKDMPQNLKQPFVAPEEQVIEKDVNNIIPE